jgi:hypothetical protein
MQKFANCYGYSDVNPYEVVRVVSEKTLEIRAMKCERDPSWKMEVNPGGFCANVSNQNDQKWFITSDESYPVSRIRLGKNGWKSKGGSKFVLSDAPVKFYDYNF